MISDKFWLKSYDNHVSPTLTYPKVDLGNFLTQSMNKYTDKIGFYFMDREFRVKEILEYSQKFATYLQKSGMKKGDVLAICLPNLPQYLFAVYGTYMAGGTIIGCSPLSSPDEIIYQLNDSGAKFLVTLDIAHEKIFLKIYDQLPNLEVIIPTNISEFMGFGKFKVFMGKLAKKIPKGKMTPYLGKDVIPFLEVLKTEIDLKKVEVKPEDLALIQYTGGTTGRPKGTEILHSNLLANIHQLSAWLDREEGKEILICMYPFFHIAGFLVGLFINFIGGTQVIIANPRDTDHIIKEINDKKPTCLGCVPTLYLLLMKNPKSKNIPQEVLDNISLYMSGAAPFPVEALKEFEKQFHTKNKFVEVYGMTETAVIVTGLPRYGEKKFGTVGIPFPDTDIKLINIETGVEVKEIGEPGEILVKGPQVVKRYHNNPEATAVSFDKDGYFLTGDVGIFDEDGYLKIVDRIKDMIIVSGFKVYSVHVEDVMTKHPDIQLIAIIGVPNPDRPGAEIVKAVVQLKEGVDVTDDTKNNIRNFAEENLSKYQVPKIWEFCKELPLSIVGKVLKKTLRDE